MALSPGQVYSNKFKGKDNQEQRFLGVLGRIPSLGADCVSLRTSLRPFPPRTLPPGCKLEKPLTLKTFCAL